MTDLTSVTVTDYPNCDLCKAFREPLTPAHYDAKTTQGFWAYMCTPHFQSHGVGLGTGRGQRLVKAEAK